MNSFFRISIKILSQNFNVCIYLRSCVKSIQFAKVVTRRNDELLHYVLFLVFILQMQTTDLQEDSWDSQLLFQTRQITTMASFVIVIEITANTRSLPTLIYSVLWQVDMSSITTRGCQESITLMITVDTPLLTFVRQKSTVI